MSKFNTKKRATTTINKAGGKAFKETDKLEFASILLTSFVKDQFYRGENDTVDRIKELVHGLKDKKFAAKAAIYARTKYGMRSVSHVVASELADEIKGQSWAKVFFEKVVYRPDDILEIISRYTKETGRKLTHAMRKGFSKVLETLNDYKLAKYKGEGKDFSMVDVVNLTHPNGGESSYSGALMKLMKGKLKPANTWETKLTQAGQQAEDEEDKAALKKDAWEDLVLEHKLGYFALLRNLRNISEQAPEIITEVCKQLVDPEAIKKSLVLPFRFITALKEVEKLSDSRELVSALSKAAEISLANVPKFDGKTLVVLDTSGSMMGQPAEIGSLFSAILYKSNDADFMNFSDEAEYHTLNATDSVMTIARNMHFRSGGTNFHAIFQKADKAYDRIIILSDMQGWMGYDTPADDLMIYRAKFKCNPKVYSFDLQGYGTLQFPENNVFCLAGFSEKVFDTMKMLETDRNALINEIEAIEL